MLAIGLSAAMSVPAAAAPLQLPRDATAVLSGNSGDDNGEAVAGAGDFNADGYQDVMRGAGGADPHALSNAGSATVTFGPIKSLPSANFQTQMFGVAAGDNAGQSVAGAGDFNGDGVDDVIVGAPNASPGGVSAAGSSYVVFGAATPPDPACLCIELQGLLTPLGRGFRIDGPAAAANSGISVAGAGDVNGDGLDDVIIGAPGASPGGATGAGSSYVVFGSASTVANVALATLTPAQGFRIDGADAGDDSGRSVAGAGDVDGDGFDDVIVGAHLADVPSAGSLARGAAYVVRGSASPVNVALASLAPPAGFRIGGAAAFDILGGSVAGAGDVNGDGRDDVIVGATFAGASDVGAAYVVFGSASPVSLVVGTMTLAQGFRMDGAAAGDDTGYSVAGARDVNGDGRDDVIVGARLADFSGNASGSSYVVFGSASPTNVALGSLSAAQGFRIDGDPAGTSSGYSVAGAGDVAGDGRDDVVIGTPSVGFGGAAYVVSGTFLPVVAYESTVTVPLGEPVDIRPTQLRSAGTKSLSVTPALPAGLVFSAATGRITGTPTVAGFTNHEVTLTDANGRTGARLRIAIVNVLGAPSVSTSAATAVANTTAQLNGSVNPHGAGTLYVFEYGTSTAFGQIAPIPSGNAGSGTATQTVNTPLSGLQPRTTYFYRLVALNALGTTTGAVQSFTTTGPAVAPSVTTAAASNITQTGALLEGTVNPHGQATTFTFEYGTTTSFGQITSVDNAGNHSSTVPVSLPASGLTPNTTYLYRIVATNASGTTVGVVMSFETAP